MVSAKHVLLNIGPLDRLDDGLPDYLGRLKNPLRPGFLLSLPWNLSALPQNLHKTIAFL